MNKEFQNYLNQRNADEAAKTANEIQTRQDMERTIESDRKLLESSHAYDLFKEIVDNKVVTWGKSQSATVFVSNNENVYGDHSVWIALRYDPYSESDSDGTVTFSCCKEIKIKAKNNILSIMADNKDAEIVEDVCDMPKLIVKKMIEADSRKNSSRDRHYSSNSNVEIKIL